MAEQVHYVAVIKLEKVIVTTAVPARYNETSPEPTREVRELGNIVIKSLDLTSLRDRVNAHVQLVEDI